ncbi:Coiled-coil domain-containing protein 69-A, partial [Calypte anna]
EQTESITFLQGQEEEQLKDAGQAETRRNTQDMSTQVEKEKYLELEEQLDALKREHTEALQELQRTHEQEKMLLVESHHKTQAALQEMIQEQNSQLKSFQETMKRVEASLLNTDYKKHIQVQG